jgi:hypothetical protein
MHLVVLITLTWQQRRSGSCSKPNLSMPEVPSESGSPIAVCANQSPWLFQLATLNACKVKKENLLLASILPAMGQLALGTRRLPVAARGKS